MLTKVEIFSDFRKLQTANEKVEYIKWLSTLNLPIYINYDNLIRYWQSQGE